MATQRKVRKVRIRKRKVKKKRKKPAKKRPQRVYKSGKRYYIRTNGKRFYFDSKSDLKKLIRKIMKEFKKKKIKNKKKRKVKRKPAFKVVKPPDVVSSSSSRRLEQDFLNKKEELEKLAKDVNVQIKALEGEKKLLITDGKKKKPNTEANGFLEDLEEEIMQARKARDDILRDKHILMQEIQRMELTFQKKEKDSIDNFNHMQQEFLKRERDAIERLDSTKRQSTRTLNNIRKEIADARNEASRLDFAEGLSFRPLHEFLKLKGKTAYKKGGGRKDRPSIVKEYDLLADEDFKNEFGEPDFVLPDTIELPLSEHTPSKEKQPAEEVNYVDYADYEGAAAQEGEGKGSDGLTDRQINTMMKKFKKYSGCWGADEMAQIPIKKQMGFIINTQPRSKGNGHWVACYIDAVKGMSVEYYDSFAGQPSKTFLKGVKVIIDQLDPSVYLKFKVNKIKEQKVSSGDCGWHAISFLQNRFKAVPFVECTGYSDYKKGLKDVKKVKKIFPKFDYI